MTTQTQTPLSLYLLQQSDVSGWDTFSRCVVAAPSEDVARNTHPRGQTLEEVREYDSTWTTFPHLVQVTFLGPADPSVQAGVVCASYHAG